MIENYTIMRALELSSKNEPCLYTKSTGEKRISSCEVMRVLCVVLNLHFTLMEPVICDVVRRVRLLNVPVSSLFFSDLCK